MRIVWIWLLIFTFVLAIDETKALQAIEANPALLNTPQAQELLKSKGISKSQLLQRIKQKERKNRIHDVNVTNVIQIDESNKKKEAKKSVKKKSKISHSFSPFQYVTQEELIAKIRSLRQQEEKRALKRYCDRFFYNKNRVDTSLLAVPEYYEVNVGDVVRIQIFGGEDKSFQTTVDRYGNIELPVIGPIHVAGLSVATIKELIETKLKPTYPNSKIVVNIDVHSMIQVTLTGFVKAPGVYNLGALSTITDLLIAAGGVDRAGSIRKVTLKRGGKVFKVIDFYQLLQEGKIVDRTILHSGDVIHIPRAKKLVALDGAVYHPAIFELLSNETLDDLIRASGGIVPEGSKKKIKIERYVKEKKKVYFSAYGKRFPLLNGDYVYVYKISQINKDLVYVFGNIDKPGSHEMPKDKKLSTLLKRLEFLKDTYYDYAVIEHEDGSITSFNLKNPGKITLKPKDLVYIFNRYEIEPVYYVTLHGDVLNAPGKYRYFKGETLKDAIHSAGGTKSYFDVHHVQILRYSGKEEPELFFIDYEKNPDFPLEPFDEITLFDYQNFHPLRPVNVFGEVNNPGTFIYAKGMKLKDALLQAGWFKDSADRDHIELLRFRIENGQRVRETMLLTAQMLDFALQPYDTITVKKIPSWTKIKKVTIAGEVRFPGTYVIKTGERLADVIERAGGFTEEAYLYGAVFTRESVRKMKEKQLDEMIFKLKRTVTLIAASAKGAGEQGLDATQLINAIDSLAQEAQKIKPIGRIALQLDADMKKFKKSPYNIALEDGDKLYVPSRKDAVTVMGEVLNETSFVYDSSSALSYIKKAGGVTKNAGETYFVVHANGFTEKGEFGGWLAGDIKVRPGDVIVVPLHIKTATWYGIAKDVSSIVYQLAVTAASLKTVGAL